MTPQDIFRSSYLTSARPERKLMRLKKLLFLPRRWDGDLSWEHLSDTFSEKNKSFLFTNWTFKFSMRTPSEFDKPSVWRCHISCTCHFFTVCFRFKGADFSQKCVLSYVERSLSFKMFLHCFILCHVRSFKVNKRIQLSVICTDHNTLVGWHFSLRYLKLKASLRTTSRHLTMN